MKEIKKNVKEISYKISWKLISNARHEGCGALFASTIVETKVGHKVIEPRFKDLRIYDLIKCSIYPNLNLKIFNISSDWIIDLIF